MDIHKAAGIIIRDRKLLVERSVGRTHFISPGGTIEPGEEPKQTLIRELMEEFKIDTAEENFEEFGTFSAPAADQEDKQVIMTVYLVKNYDGEPTPDNEVEEIAWITSAIPEGMKVGSIFEHDVIPRLKSEGLID